MGTVIASSRSIDSGSASAANYDVFVAASCRVGESVAHVEAAVGLEGGVWIAVGGHRDG